MLNTIGPTQCLLFKLVFPLMVFLVSTANLHAQDKPVLAPANAPVEAKKTMTPKQAFAISEMSELQKEFGSVSERFEGVVPGADLKQFGHDKLVELVTQERTATVPLMLPSPPTQPLKRENRPAKRVAQATLRASAKKLEDLAAELEQVQFYDQADELRGIAAKYWLQARSMD